MPRLVTRFKRFPFDFSLEFRLHSSQLAPDALTLAAAQDRQVETLPKASLINDGPKQPQWGPSDVQGLAVMAHARSHPSRHVDKSLSQRARTDLADQERRRFINDIDRSRGRTTPLPTYTL